VVHRRGRGMRNDVVRVRYFQEAEVKSMHSHRYHRGTGRTAPPTYTNDGHGHGSRHAHLCNLQSDRGLTPAEVTELLNLREATGRAVRPRNAYGEVLV